MKRNRLPVLPHVAPERRVKRPKAASEAERRERLRENTVRYQKTLKGRYNKQKRNAKQRGIEFTLSFDEWLSVWEASGRLDARGNHTSDNCVMGRYGDTGPYALDNVKIITHAENVAERNTMQAARRRRYNFSSEDMTESWLHVHSAADAD